MQHLRLITKRFKNTFDPAALLSALATNSSRSALAFSPQHLCWSRKLGGSRAPKIPRRCSSSFEGRSRLLGCHGNGGFDIGQATPASRSQYGRGCRFVVREFPDHQPVMLAEGQVPTDKPTSDA